MSMDNNAVCPICCEFKSLERLGCSHCLCLVCLQNYINEKVNDSECEIPCPIYSCNEKISYTFINQLVDEYVVKKLDRNIVKQTVNSSDDLKFCPKCDAVWAKDENDTVYCDHCEYSFCYVCGGHKSGYHSCNLDEIDEIRDAIRLEINDEYKSIKNCPKCRIIINKFTGCDCVKCVNCRFRFCWNCLRLEKDIEDKAQHRDECMDYEAFAESDTPDPSDSDTPNSDSSDY